jgi:hypothetical protein
LEIKKKVINLQPELLCTAPLAPQIIINHKINKMKKLTITLLILLLFGTTYGQTTGDLKVFSVKELRDDVDSLTKYIEETHPNAFFKYSKDRFYKDARILKSSIAKPLNSLEFYLLISPLVAKLEDGHTGVQFPQMEYLNSGASMFPFNVKLTAKKPYIRVIRPFRTMESLIPNNSEIISINGIESKKIVNDIIACISGESPDIRAGFGSNYFYFFLNKLYGMNDSYKVIYNTDGKLETKEISGISYNTYMKRVKQDTTIQSSVIPSNYSLKLQPESNTAIIDFVSFNNPQEFKVFIDSAFKQINTNQIKNLIIDIRNNGGGNSAIGDEFFQYISKVPYTQNAKSKIRFSYWQKEKYRQQFLESQDSSWFKIKDIPDGSIDEETNTTTVELRENANRFKGKIYLLTSINTYSSAASFAQCFKHYKMGEIIGEETGGWIIHYGNLVMASLPNTKMNLNISGTKWLEIGAKENDFHGTIPDIIVPSENALDYTLELIKKQ